MSPAEFVPPATAEPEPARPNHLGNLQQAILDHAAVAFEAQTAIMVTDAEQRILLVNPAFSHLTGYAAHEAIGQRPTLLKSARQTPAFYQQLWQTLNQADVWEGEIWNRRKSGEDFPEWLTIKAIRSPQGTLTHYVATFTDLSALKAAEQAAEQLAFHDPLTGLANRRRLLEQLAAATQQAAQEQSCGALLMLDLDHFERINDAHGHAAGDQILRTTASRLQACLPASDLVARLGGDKFVILCQRIASSPAAAAVAAEQRAIALQEALAEAHVFKDKLLHCTASFGLALFDRAARSSEILLRQLDLALQKAKDSGRNSLRFFDDAMQAAMARRAHLEQGLRQALAGNELSLHVQPQVDPGRRLIGAECLLRWQPADAPAVSPAEFIPLAEETGLILPIGAWVIDQACAHLQRWSQHPATSALSLSVNVSARQFRQDDFVPQVADCVRRHGIDPTRLKLEVTESLLLDNVEEIVSKMRQLIGLGIRFSLDDFGTGYASLAYLKRFPFDQLKVDRSFIRDLNKDPDDAAIVGAILAMGHALRLNVVAEGVEQSEQLSFLVEHGCRNFQGYLFGRPMSFTEFEGLLPNEANGRFPAPATRH